ncbi:MAG: hypothetical protein ACM3WV_04330 [Bacillota bacterium]
MKKIIVVCAALLFLGGWGQAALGDDSGFGFGVQTYLIMPHLSLKIPLTEEFGFQVMAFPWRMEDKDYSSYGARVIYRLSGWDQANFRAYTGWGMIWGEKEATGYDTDAILIFGIEQKKGLSEFAHSLEIGVNWDNGGDVYPVLNYGCHYYF